MKKFLKKLFCKHEYIVTTKPYIIDGGFRKMGVRTCKKCGKIQVFFI